MRLVKYIELTGDTVLAERELNRIRFIHPEFWDKRISNLKRIQQVINNYKEYGTDLLIVFTNNSCPICKKYNRKIFSLSGKNSKYPKLPVEILQKGGFCPECSLDIHFFLEGISTSSEE